MMRINHFDLTRYLNELGWNRISNKRSDIAIFQTLKNNKRWQITVPLSTELCDYEDAITQDVQTLVEYTGLPENLLQLEIVFSKADVLRFRLENENVLIGTYDMEEVVNFYDNVKKLVVATALDCTSPKLYQTGRKTESAKDFLLGCRFGQTEIGSYSVPLICNEIIDSPYPLFPEMNYSFSRSIEYKLLNTVNGVKEAIKNGTFNEDNLLNADKPDMSTMFLSALHSIIESHTSVLGINAHWNSASKSTIPTIHSATIDHEFASPIKRVVDNINKRIKRENKYYGRITKCMSDVDPQKREFGTITLKYQTSDNKLKSVNVRLKGTDYATAVDCHAKGYFVQVIGAYGKDGKTVECQLFESMDSDE